MLFLRYLLLLLRKYIQLERPINSQIESVSLLRLVEKGIRVLTGLLKAKTNGLSLYSAILFKIVLVKVDPTVDKPNNAVGLTCSTTDNKVLKIGASGSALDKYCL